MRAGTWLKSIRVPRAALAVSAIALLLVMGLGLRLVGLGEESLWADEAEVLRRSGRSITAILAESARQALLDGPGSYLITHVMLLVSDGEAWLRLQSVAWSLLGIIGLAGLARRLSGSWLVSVAAVALLVMAPFDIRYAQELRYYAAASALQVASWFFFIGWRRSASRSEFIAYVAASGGLLYMATTYGVLVLSVQALVGLAIGIQSSGSWRERLRIAGAPVAAALTIAPWLGLALYLRTRGAKPIAIHEDVRLELTFDLPVRFFSWLVANTEPWAPLGAVLVGVAAIGLVLAARRRQWWVIAVFLVAMAEFAALTVGAYALGTNLAFRRALLVLPLILLVAAAGFVEMATILVKVGRLPTIAWARPSVAGLLIVVVAILSTGPLADYGHSEKPAYRQAVEVASRDDGWPLVVVGPAEETVFPAVEHYAALMAVDTVRFGDLARALAAGEPPEGWSDGRSVLWLTVAPVTAPTYQGGSPNDLEHLQIISGDRGYPDFRMAAFIGGFGESRDLCSLQDLAIAVARSTARTDFPVLPVTRSAANRALEVMSTSPCTE